MASTRKSNRSGKKSKGRSAAGPVKARGKRAGAKPASPMRKSAARASSKKKASAPRSTARKKRGSGKRDLVKTPTGTFFAHREADGSFREMDEVGRSLAADRRQKAKTEVDSGYGDRGDR